MQVLRRPSELAAVIGKVGPGTDRPQSHETTYQSKSFGTAKRPDAWSLENKHLGNPDPGTI